MANIYIVFDHIEGEPCAAFESEKDAQDFIDEESSEDDIDEGRGEIFELHLNKHKKPRSAKTCQRKRKMKTRH